MRGARFQRQIRRRCSWIRGRRRLQLGIALLIVIVGIVFVQRGDWSPPESQRLADRSVITETIARGNGPGGAMDADIGQEPATDSLGTLHIGSYITNVSDIDLLEDRFSIEMLVWSLWNGDQASDPSDSLIVLNGIYDDDIQRFDKVRSTSQGDGTWALHRVRTAVVNRWNLKNYPFDDQLLHVEIGLDDPLENVQLEVAEPDPIAVSPGLHLPGWLLKESSAYPTSLSLMSNLGTQTRPGQDIHRQPTISFDIEIERRSLLYLAPDFLGYILAIGLCCLSLVISRSRDDLILAAVVSAAGNYVFIASKLPVSAMAGFIGNLQIIIFFGILYVIAIDELLNEHLIHWTSRSATLLRICLLPSYLGLTLLGVALIIPPASS